MKLNRRNFIGSAAAVSAAVSAPMVMGASHGRPKVVVIGGGAGGATVARYLAKDSKGAIDVTLIEPTPRALKKAFGACSISSDPPAMKEPPISSTKGG